MNHESKKNNKVGQGIALAGLCLAAAWLEISGKQAGGLWALAVLCFLCF